MVGNRDSERPNSKFHEDSCCCSTSFVTQPETLFQTFDLVASVQKRTPRTKEKKKEKKEIILPILGSIYHENQSVGITKANKKKNGCTTITPEPEGFRRPK